MRTIRDIIRETRGNAVWDGIKIVLGFLWSILAGGSIGRISAMTTPDNIGLGLGMLALILMLIYLAANRPDPDQDIIHFTTELKHWRDECETRIENQSGWDNDDSLQRNGKPFMLPLEEWGEQCSRYTGRLNEPEFNNLRRAIERFARDARAFNDAKTIQKQNGLAVIICQEIPPILERIKGKRRWLFLGST